MGGLDLRRLVRRILLSVFLLSLLAGTGGFYVLLTNEAMRRAEQEARVMLASAVAVGDYTVTHILPKLSKVGGEQFEEEMVPFFATQTVFRSVSGKAKLYTYRDPALNPTNPANRPTPFDMEVIRRFRDDPALSELTGVRTTDEGRIFYLARPVRVDSDACLTCHSTPDRAPAVMVARYGPYNGFGWTLGETVGLQMLTVPLTEPFKGTLRLVGLLAGGLLLMFAAAYLALTVALETAILRPLDLLSRAADAASLSATVVPKLSHGGTTEVQRLATAIERLRVSLAKALADASRADDSRRGE